MDVDVNNSKWLWLFLYDSGQNSTIRSSREKVKVLNSNWFLLQKLLSFFLPFFFTAKREEGGSGCFYKYSSYKQIQIFKFL